MAADCSDSKPHLLLLSKFLKGADPTFSTNSVSWEQVLGEKPDQSIIRFEVEGLIAASSLETKLSNKYSVDDIKKMLKERGLKQTGKKKEIVDRLVLADRNGIEKLVNDVVMSECTAHGRSISQRFLDDLAQERTRAESETFAFLKNHDIANAVRTVFAFERTQVFKRGMNMDWSDSESSSFVEQIEYVLGNRPAILDGVSDEALSQLRLAVAMMHLWGVTESQKWLPADFRTGIDFDNETAARMMLFSASFQRELGQFRKIGVGKVIVLACDDHTCCAACREISGRTFTIDAVPELPYPKCVCEFGCRCRVIGVDIENAILERIRRL